MKTNSRLFNKITAAALSLITALSVCSVGAEAFAFAPGNEPVIREYTVECSDDFSDVRFVDSEGNVFDDSPAAEENEIRLCAAAPETLPSSYIPENLITARNQGQSSTCWAFSTISALGIYGMKKYGLDEENAEFSVSHLVQFGNMMSKDTSDPLYGDGFNVSKPFGLGNNIRFVTGVLTRGSGLVYESDYPTPERLYSDTAAVIDESARYAHNAGIVNRIEYLKTENGIKSAIENNGAVIVSIPMDQSKINSKTYAYNLKTECNSYHQVTLVGWDDDYSRSNFISGEMPKNDGAWLVLNSWGSNWGNNGYMWISYEIAGISDEATLSYVPASTYDNIYQYDGFGCSRKYSAGGYGMAAANVFIADEDEYVDSAGLNIPYSNSCGTVSIYRISNRNYSNPDEGSLAAVQQYSFENEGYYTVELDSPVHVNKGDIFSVVVKFDSFAGNEPAVAAEKSGSVSGNLLYAHGEMRQSYLGTVRTYNRTEMISWSPDFGTDGNVCIKAYTTSESRTAGHRCSYITSYDWSDDYGSCTASAVCSADPSHTVTEETTDISCEVYTAPACLDKGSAKYTAVFSNPVFANHSATVNNLPALGHDFGEYVSDHNATPVKDGTKTAKCTRCSAARTVTDVGSSSAVKAEYTYSWNAACTKCTCKITSPDCPGFSHIESAIVKRTVAAEATCTENGVSCYTAAFSRYNIPSVTKTADDIPALEHRFINYVSDGNASCEKDGTKTAVCERCGQTDTVTDKGSAMGHHFSTVVIAPTCTEDGYTVYTCECGFSRTGDRVPAAGHKTVDTVTPPTCTERGYTTHVCSCGYKYTDSVVRAVGHTFTHYVYNNDATAEKDGTETAKCEYCEKTDTRTANGSRLNGKHASVRIKGNSGIGEIGYGETVTLTADSENLPAGSRTVWYINGEKTTSGRAVTLTDLKEDMDVEVFAFGPDGKIVTNTDGTQAGDRTEIRVGTSFYYRLIAFLRSLFKALPVISKFVEEI